MAVGFSDKFLKIFLYAVSMIMTANRKSRNYA